ncbi:MAG: DUF1460 domain-containing protein [bacterium]|nr:DUF1460 domain-containing protein [bacterium]
MAMLPVAVGVALLAGCPPARRAEPAEGPRPTDSATAATDLADRPLYTFTESELGQYLPVARDRWPELTERVVSLGRQNIGQPYDIYLLGEFPYELHDADPIYCLTKSDCVTFCEHTFAAALSSDWWSYLQTLQRIRYRDDQIGMLTRNHYTVADWDRSNSFLFEDLSAKLGGGQVAVPLRQTCRRSRFFAKFGIGQDIPDEPIEDAYVPKERVPDILDELRSADFVNIIRGGPDSQWAGHTGLIAIGDGGTVNFLHSARPAVREQPLVEYVNKDRRCVGIKILRLRPEAESIMTRALASSPRATQVSEASMAQALAQSREAAPTAARPQSLDWLTASRLQAYRIGHDAPVDPDLQRTLEQIDERTAGELGIPDDDRAIGVLDLTDLRLACVRPDQMFYAASVPKIAILLAYFATHPEATADLPDDVAAELGRMIKVSDNELAAEYGRAVGLEKVQEVLQSKRYRFYDEKHGGGLWYGKHYAQGQPRIGDPLYDHSHGATVRQVLRYYLMLEQGRLVSATASAKIKAIFAAPELEHIDSKFVAGLQGRDLSLIRKSGTWEDWHLDTARIAHGERVYLLAGMVHHPRGAEYLASAAAAIDEALCGPPTDKPFSHEHVLHQTEGDFSGGHLSPGLAQSEAGKPLLTCPLSTVCGLPAWYESPVIETDHAFNEVLVSCNVAAPPNVGVAVEVRVGRRADRSWSPYLHVVDWGRPLPASERVVECEQGHIEVDYFTSDRRFDRVQYRIQAVSGSLPGVRAAPPARARIDRVAVCLTDTTRRVTSLPAPEAPVSAEPERWQRRLPVPFRSQRVERKELAGRTCSPTSVAMVLDYRGVTRPTEEVAQRIYDSTYEIYGNWPRAVQTAYTYGVPGYLARFSDWTDVERMIAAGQPLVISIVAEPGELRGAPYKSTDGHLLVLNGFDGDGTVAVNDPAARTPADGLIHYARGDLERVWMQAKGGTAYVLLPVPDESTSLSPGTGTADEPLVDLTTIDPRIVIDVPYASADNFAKQQLYPVARCLLRRSVALRLSRVQDRLVRQGLGLKVFDGYRPLSVQRKMWAIVPDSRYVADPAKGSRHNRGAAVDATLVDASGRELEMPTGYDDFTPVAHRDYTGGTELSRRNRGLLEAAMAVEGFTGIATEWWHFDAPGWDRYPLEDVPLGD